MESIELAKKLLKINSVSGQEEEIGEFLAERLAPNFKIKKQKVGSRFNILATNGNPKLLFTTHIDTVPGILEVKEDEKYLYGRGACDTKGIIASMVVAAEKAVNMGYKNFGLLFDVSEETDFSGIEKAISLANPEFVVVGEPTDLCIVIGQKGLIGIKIISRGKKAPGAMPENGKNAIVQLVKILKQINCIKLSKSNIGMSTINIGKINGGIAPNVVPDYAEAIIEFRTTVSNNEILDKIKIITDSFEILYSFEPVMLKSNISFMDKFSLKKITVPYFTEMYFWAKKSKAIVFGPGEYKVAHSDKERISKEEMIKAEKIYLEIIKEFNHRYFSDKALKFEIRRCVKIRVL